MIVLPTSYEATHMERTRLSSKGQVILPKAVRAAHRWKPGTEFVVENTDDGVLLRPSKPFGTTRLDEVRGCTGYRGKPKTLKDMERAIAVGARARR